MSASGAISPQRAGDDVSLTDGHARRAARPSVAHRRLAIPASALETGFKALVDQLPGIFYVRSADNQTPLYISPQLTHMLGYEVDDWMANHSFWVGCLHPDDREAALAARTDAYATQSRFVMDYRVIARDGRTVWIHDECALVLDADGAPLYWQGIVSDVTQQKQDEEAFRFQRALLDAQREASVDGILVATEEGEIIAWNRRFVVMWGIPLEILERRSLAEVRAWALPQLADPEGFVLQAPQAVTGSLHDVRDEMALKDGRVFERYTSPARGSDGTLFGSVWHYRDVTDRRNAQAKLAEAEERYRMLVENIPAASYLEAQGSGDGASRPVFISPQIEALTGYSPECWKTNPDFFTTIIHPDDQKRRTSEMIRTDESEASYRNEYRIVHRDGHVVWLRNEADLIRDVDGNPLYWHGAIYDITAEKQAVEALQESEHRFRTLVERATDIVTILDSTGVITYQSATIQSILGYDPDSLLGVSVFDRIHPDDTDRVRGELNRIASQSSQSQGVEFRFPHADGTWHWMESSARNFIHDDIIAGIVVNSRDITERKEAEAQRAEAESRYRTLVEQIPAAVYIDALESDAPTQYASPYHETILGYPADAWTTNTNFWASILHPEDRARVMAAHEQARLAGTPWHDEYRMLAVDGGVVWVRDEAVIVRDEDGEPRYWQGFLLDITERKELERELTHQAFHDALTALPNRALLIDRVQQALLHLQREPGCAGLLFLDLDNFKVINDSLGHATGDRLLIEVAQRLRKCIRDVDTVSRFGGDEFAILLTGLHDVGAVTDVATRIINVFQQPFVLDGRAMHISTSIGIALSATWLDQPGDLLRWADIAMYRAKAKGKNQYDIFDAEMFQVALQRLELEGAIRRALEGDELVLHYQPIIVPETGAPYAVEALVRWQHPERGLLPPSEFIPVAEETRLSVPIGIWVLNEACRQARRWRDCCPGADQVRISVNLSAWQFQQPDLVDQVRRALDDAGVDPSCLVLEITEGTVMDDAESAIEQLRALKALGVSLAIDDFGTGYSSLAYLHRFPVDVLKIDRSFVSSIGTDHEGDAIVAATIGLAHALGLVVVAEGVETEAQLERLRELHCDRAQGFLIGRPLPATDLPAILPPGPCQRS
jgi:diguanylate cyclase (GGDEF)-like protein/PAS domain S-box-containing protein